MRPRLRTEGFNIGPMIASSSHPAPSSVVTASANPPTRILIPRRPKETPSNHRYTPSRPSMGQQAKVVCGLPATALRKGSSFCPTHHTWFFPDLCNHPPATVTATSMAERGDGVTAILVPEHSMVTISSPSPATPTSICDRSPCHHLRP